MEVQQSVRFTDSPSIQPTSSSNPTIDPTTLPSANPSTLSPSTSPSSNNPIFSPSAVPSSVYPSTYPSSQPTVSTQKPSSNLPTIAPTSPPSANPSTLSPSTSPSSINPTIAPTRLPSTQPTTFPPSTSPSTFPSSSSPTFDPTILVNTGMGAAGSRDPYWKIISVPSGTTGFTAGSNAIIMTAHPAWGKSNSSKWIGVTARGTTNVPAGNYLYQLTFASASYYSTKRVEVSFKADNKLSSVAVSNGSATIQTITTFSGTNSYRSFSSFNLTAFGPTTTTLTFNISNGGTSPSGLMVQFAAPVSCKCLQIL